MGVAQLYHDRGSYHGMLDAKKCRIIATALFRHARRHTIHCSRSTVRYIYIVSFPRIIRLESHFLGKPIYDVYII